MTALLVDLMTEFVSSKSSTHIKKGFRSFGNLNWIQHHRGFSTHRHQGHSWKPQLNPASQRVFYQVSLSRAWINERKRVFCLLEVGIMLRVLQSAMLFNFALWEIGWQQYNGSLTRLFLARWGLSHSDRIEQHRLPRTSGPVFSPRGNFIWRAIPILLWC